MTRRSTVLLAGLFFIVAALPLRAQTGSAQTVSPNILPEVNSSDFPLWAQDLRRGEIVAFGSFPFTMFLSTLAMDSYRYFSHNKDERYAPWPLKGPGAIEMTRDERKDTMLLAATVSVGVAVIDFTIVQIKRGKEKKRIRQQNYGGEIQISRTAGEEP